MMIFGTSTGGDNGASGTVGRGCFYAVTEDISTTAGAVIKMPKGVKLPDKDTHNSFVIGLTFDQHESFSLQKCFNDVNYIYTFGHDIGNVSVSFLVFLKKGVSIAGKSLDTSMDNAAINKILKLYQDNRIYKAKDVVTISFGGDSTCLTGYLVGMSSSTYSNILNIQQFTFQLMSTKLQGAGT